MASTHKPGSRVLSEAESTRLLDGLPRDSWGGYVLLGLPLIDPEGHFIEGTATFPPDDGQPPVETTLLSCDMGKRAFKLGGVDRFCQYQSVMIPDAYCRARDVQHEEEEGGEQGISTWKVIEKEKRGGEQGNHAKATEPEQFWIGDAALKFADELPITETHLRLRERRFRNFFYASIVQALMQLGYAPTVFEDDIEVVKTHYVCITLGLPYRDFVNMDAATVEALRNLKGPFTLERFNTRTGKVETWNVHVSRFFPLPQSRGTHYGCCLKLNGESAIEKIDLVTIVDGGGGDTHSYEVDTSGAFTLIGERLGDGTVEIAKALRNLVRDRHRIRLSVAEAQEALYKWTIRKAGRSDFDITPLIEELHPRFENLLTRMDVTEPMLATLIIYTGGIAALLHDELKAKLDAMGLEAGKEYLIVPAPIAAIINCVGIFAHGYYKVHKELERMVREYIELVDRRTALQEKIALLQRQPAKHAELQQHLAEMQRIEPRIEQIDAAAHYPAMYRKLAEQQPLGRQG